MTGGTREPRELLTNAIRQLRAARARIEALERTASEPLAVRGAAVRLPGGVESLDALWGLVRDGGEVVSRRGTNPDGRRAPGGGQAADGWGGWLTSVDGCDIDFFELNQLEAAHMDPQQRIALEVAWEAVEDAGLPLERLQAASTGVFMGVYATDYLALQLADPEAINAYTGPGGALSMTANRISYLLDLKGPSVSLDTACSSSLTAVHLACRALRQGDCDFALVGGVSVMLSPLSARIAERVLPLSPTGCCRPFSADADGIVRGEGCAMLVLQREGEARGDGGRIRGLIRGTAINQDGRSNGLTAPNPIAQGELHRRALADAGADPADVVFIEAHGTGTSLGDPIELQALGEVYGAGGRPCAIGSVKSNLGHLEAAAGVVGLVKALLVLEHGHAPPNPHLGRINPEITLERTRLTIPTELTALPGTKQPAFAAISAFGFGGANAHAILQAATDERAPAREARPDDDAHLLVVSARSEPALRRLIAAYAERLAGCDGAEAAELCAAAARQRTHHPHRAAFTGINPQRLTAQLHASAASTACGSRVPGRRPRLAFIFTGQGSQWPQMGDELIRSEPVVAAEVAACDAIVRELADWSVVEQLTRPAGSNRLDETAVAQVAIGVLQLALLALWRSWGIEPDAVAGHSMGEILAACAAGVIERAGALELLVRRGQIAERSRGGAMASIDLPADEVQAVLDATSPSEHIAVAAVNGPRSTVVSGTMSALTQVERAAAAAGVPTRRLRVNYAFHSPLLDSGAAELAAATTELQPHDGRLPLYSTVTGERALGHSLDSAHWRRNLRDPVRFWPAIQALARDGISTFVEVGPHPALLRDIHAILDASRAPRVVVATLRRGQPARAALHASLADLFTAGVTIRWEAVFRPPRRPVALPSYPWQRRRFWFTDADGGKLGFLAPADPRPSPLQASARSADLTQYVRERVAAAAALRLEDVSSELALETLGLSSLAIVELRNQVERELGVRVPLAALLEGGTATELGGVIREALADAQSAELRLTAEDAGARR